MGPLRRLFLAWPIVVLALLLGPAARAQSDGDQPASAGLAFALRAGFDGFYRPHYWVPVQVEVANDGPAVTGVIRITTGSAAANTEVVYEAPVELPNRSRKRLSLYVFLNSFTNALRADLLDGRGRVLTQTRSNTLRMVPDDSLLYGVAAADPGELASLEKATGDRPNAVVAVLSLEELPAVAVAWPALDILVLHEVDSGRLSPEQRQSLLSWIDTGGQLVLAGGPGWQGTTAGLEDLLPVRPTGTVTLADLPTLPQLAGRPLRDPGPYLVTAGSLREGDVLLNQDGLPLLARRSQGRGAVYFLALDPASAPLLDWDGADQVWDLIARAAPYTPFWATGVKESFSARNAVRNLSSLSLPSAWLVLLFLVGYVLIMGPGNYLVLRRINRRELAWLTIPGLVVLFSAGTYLVGLSTRGNNVIINQMSVAYGQTDGEQMRVHTLLGLYSPRRAGYDMVLPAGALIRPFRSTYGGVGEGGSIGGIEQGAEVTVHDIRVDVSGTETFLADLMRPTLAVDGSVVLRLDGERFALDVDVRNNSPLTLENVSLIIGGTVTGLGDLAPGQQVKTTRRLAGAGFSSGASSAPRPVFGPTGAASPLLNNDRAIFGTTAVYQDPAVRARRELVSALHDNFGGPGSALTVPQGTVTLLAWSEQQQLQVDVRGRDETQISTTLYLLELPFSQVLASGQGLRLTEGLLAWQVIDSSGLYPPGPEELYLSNGWIELEYTPWLELPSLRVTGLELDLMRQTGGVGTTLPLVRLWDWEQKSWITAPVADWGLTPVLEPARFLGPGHAIRIRLQNDTFTEIRIRHIYPVLIGDLPSNQ